MKTIGVIGGLTWLSTVDYYTLLNQMVNEKLGDVSSAKIILFSVEFAEIKMLTQADRWDDIAAIISEAAQKLEKSGADCLLIGANTMHKIADKIQASVNIPIIHIASETAKVVSMKQLKTVALLGTKYTMQLDFYKNKLEDKNITVIIPNDEADIEFINDAIYNEMGKGIFLPETKERFIIIIDSLIKRGAEGIVLGCTEIPILIKQEDCSVPVFDTTNIHAHAAVEFALN
ncbi:MAG: aspartate/glutamate racemase family protein [Panacibacter sp.]